MTVQEMCNSAYIDIDVLHLVKKTIGVGIGQVIAIINGCKVEKQSKMVAEINRRNDMAKISKKVLEEIEDVLSRGCDYADTQEVVHESFAEALEELGGEGDWDEMTTTDLNDNDVVLQDLFETFYDKTIEKIMNVIRTQE